MFIKDWKKELFTIPNMLSLFRLLLIPVYVVIYLNAKSTVDYFIAGGILAVSCLTDMIDGQIARHFNMISNIGKILDPFADKITQLTMIVCLAIKHPVLQTLMFLFVIKESFQLIAGCLTLRKGQMLNGALITGKISTTVLFTSLILLVLLPDMDEQYINVIMWIDTVFLLIAFIHYAVIYFTHSSMIQSLDNTSQDDKAE